MPTTDPAPTDPARYPASLTRAQWQALFAFIADVRALAPRAAQRVAAAEDAIAAQLAAQPAYQRDCERAS